MALQCIADLQGALNWCCRTSEEHQCHSIAGRQSHQFSSSLCRTELFRTTDDLIELLLQLALIVDQQFRVTDSVDKEDVRDLKLNLFFNFSGHDLLRRGRAGEFLEAWIIPERIEHWIEPEQCGSDRHV